MVGGVRHGPGGGVPSPPHPVPSLGPLTVLLDLLVEVVDVDGVVGAGFLHGHGGGVCGGGARGSAGGEGVLPPKGSWPFKGRPRSSPDPGAPRGGGAPGPDAPSPQEAAPPEVEGSPWQWELPQKGDLWGGALGSPPSPEVPPQERAARMGVPRPPRSHRRRRARGAARPPQRKGARRLAPLPRRGRTNGRAAASP